LKSMKRATPLSISKTLLIFILACIPCAVTLAQTTKDRRGMGKLRQKLEIADSMRLAMRRAADEGRLLQWGDSLLRTRLSRGEINEQRYEKLQARLRRVDRRLHQGDSLLAKSGGKVNFDTLYMARPQGRWVIKWRANLSGAELHASGVNSQTTFNGSARSAYRGTLSMAVAYRGIGLAAAINPAKLAGKSKDNEFNLNAYGNKFGVDVVLLSSETYSGTVETDAAKIQVGKGNIQQKALNVNAYYAFNGRRFSFPAAFSQSYKQLHSAGSWLIGLSFDGQHTNLAGTDLTYQEPVHIKLYELGIGMGYGYNFVLARHWLLHLSLLPTFDIYTHSHVMSGNQRVKMKYFFPSFIVTARSAALYTWRNKFTGLTFVMNSSSADNDNHLQIRRDKWRLRLFFGFRF